MSVLDGYLRSILGLLRSKNSEELKLYLRVEPPLPEQFIQLSQELKTSYRDNKALERKVEQLLPESENATPEEANVWPGFLAFIQEYLQYWRDIDFDDLLGTHQQLSALTK
jgi:hypothetical protein